MDKVLTERRGRVLVITLNRAEARNSLDNETTDALADALRALGSDDELAAAVLTGAGSGFCSGLDLKALKAEGPPRQIRALLRDRSPKPLVAAVEGYALAGGFELTLMCDLVVAARGAKVALPEATRGLLATGGALFRLPRPLALEMILTGAVLTTDQLAAHGVITRLVEPGEALTVAAELAATIADNAPLPIKHARELINAAASHTEAEMWELQMDSRNLIFASNDAAEGATAFAEKRPPRWTGT